MDLAAIRDNRNITQQELADQIGITRQMISAIENGESPSVKTAKALASILGLNWYDFFPDPPQT